MRPRARRQRSTSTPARCLFSSNFEVGEEIQLQGCVVAGEESGTYVFSRVTAWPVAVPPEGRYGPRHFWLADAANYLQEHVGRTIQVTGIVDLRESEIERNPQFTSQDGGRVGIELPTGDVLTKPSLAGISPGATREQDRHEDHAREGGAGVAARRDTKLPGPGRPASPLNSSLLRRTAGVGFTTVRPKELSCQKKRRQ